MPKTAVKKSNADKKSTIVQKHIFPALVYSAIRDLEQIASVVPKPVATATWRTVETFQLKSEDKNQYSAQFSMSQDLISALDQMQEAVVTELNYLKEEEPFPTKTKDFLDAITGHSSVDIVPSIVETKPIDPTLWPNTEKYIDSKHGISCIFNVDNIFAKKGATKLIAGFSNHYLDLLRRIAIHFAGMIMTSTKKYSLNSRHLFLALYAEKASAEFLALVTTIIIETEENAVEKAKEAVVKRKKTAKKEKVAAKMDKLVINDDESDPDS